MGAESTVKYAIEVTKTGEGATLAVNDFKAVEAAAAKTNATMAQNTTAMTTVTATTKTATASLKAMQGTLTLVGLQTFPQLTLAATTAQTALSGVKTAATAAGVSVAAMGAQLAVITAGAYAAARGVMEFSNMMAAMKGDNASGVAADASDAKTAAAFKTRIMNLIEQGKLSLSDADAAELDRLLEHNQFRLARQIVQSKMPTGEFMSESERAAEVRDRMAQITRENSFSDAVRNTGTRNAGQIRTEADRQAEISRVQAQSVKYVEELNRLREEGIITAQQEFDLTREIDITRMNNIAEIKNALTDLQQLQGQVAQQFAAGFANAFVSFLDGTKSAKEAFADFARSFLSQVAQMIMQQVILNALRNVGFAGLAQGGVRFAADGLTGVQSVSSPTYFPKFNVVAGEAGREMLTVLARPRMMEVGGMQAVVGSAQGNRLAITSADALAQAGGGAAGGTIVIQVQGTPDFEARVISNSVKGAQVQVANDMRADTPISRGVKGLTS